MQVKVYEAEVRLVESGTKRLLQRPKADSTMTMTVAVEKMSLQHDDDEEDEQIQDNDDSVTVKPPTPPPVVVETPPARKPARKIGAVVKK
jgi:hypothetical protein